MNAINSFLNKISNIPVLLLACILFVTFIVYFLPGMKEATEAYSRDVGSVGLSFFPHPDKVYEMAEAYGEEGRRAYIKVWLTIDVMWPLVYSVLFLVCINLSLGYVHGEKGSRLCAAALIPLALDWFENILAVIIMARYPLRMDTLAWVMAFATCIKWISMGCVCCLFAYGLVALPFRFVSRKIKND
jgi:hypothetical protein